MSQGFSLAKLEEIAKKPQQYFYYEAGDSYTHELEGGNLDPDLHVGGVEEVLIVRTSSWHGMSTSDITVEVEDGIILTSDGYLCFADNNNPDMAVAYNLSDVEDIHHIWDERFKASGL